MLCAKQHSRLLSFLTVVDPDLPSGLCDDIPPLITGQYFNPYEEKKKILKEWLKYRGVTPGDDIIKQVKNDMNNQGPPFNRFLFDPADASISFMMFWLSWYGMTSDSMKDREWWETKVTAVQSFVKKIPKRKVGRNVLKKWAAVNTKWTDMCNKLELVDDCLEALTPQEFQSVLAEQPTKLSLTWNPSSKVLAFFFNTAAVAVPLLYLKGRKKVQKKIKESKKAETLKDIFLQRVQANWDKRLAQVLVPYVVDAVSQHVVDIPNQNWVTIVTQNWIEDFLGNSDVPVNTIIALLQYHVQGKTKPASPGSILVDDFLIKTLKEYLS